MKLKSIFTGNTVLRLALAGVIPVIVTLLFLWAGGWLAPERLTSGKLVDVLEKSSGVHPTFRRNHAKGICVLGRFISNGNASVVSRAPLFLQGETAVTGRFAIAGGNPHAPDYAVPVRSMALLFQQANGEQWRTGMNAMPFFPVASVEAFYQLQTATRPDAQTGKVDVNKLNAFIARHPEAKPFFAWAKQYKPSASWASDRFNSLNAFRLIDAAGNAHLVRWSMVPNNQPNPVSEMRKHDADFLQQDLVQRLKQGVLRWDLIITLAQAGDKGNDATQAWPADRQTIHAGTLVISQATPQQIGPCNDINFDPLILPDGIAASDDPLLNGRSSAYAKSYNLRTREQSQQAGEKR